MRGGGPSSAFLPGQRFIAYLLAGEKPAVDFKALERGLAESFSVFAKTLQPLQVDSLEGSGFGFVVAGVAMTCIVVPAQLPRTEWENGAKSNMAWANAQNVAQNHQSHIVIAPIEDVKDRADGLRKALATTIATAALAPSSQAVGVCWYPAQTLVEAGAFVEAAHGSVAGTDLGELPLDAWMRLEFGRIEGRYAAVARGLLPLLGHDLMHVADAPDPAAQGGVLYNVTGYLLREGKAFADGDTMDVGDEKLVARHAEGMPLIRLEPAGAEQGPNTAWARRPV